MSKARPPLLVIAGPTASGKSALALEAARRLDGVIVNADASQLYSEIPILSAAPTAADRKVVEHRLYGSRSGAVPCSAAEWAEEAKREIASIHAEGRMPILAGGTGMYLRTLLDGIAPVPPIDETIRAEVRAANVSRNRGELERLDPQAASKLKPGDTSRIARALEVVRSSGRTLADWQKQKVGGIGDDVNLTALVLIPPREWLYDRCDRRFADMIENGAVEEVERLLELGLVPETPVMRAIGVTEIADWLSGDISRQEMLARGCQSTRRYAKRQYTWFAHQPPRDWVRFSEPLDSGPALRAALELLGARS